MRHEIVLAPEAVSDLRWLRAVDRSAVQGALEEWLRFESQKLSRSRIKRLQGPRKPQYRLRVGDVRVFYDVSGSVVEILAIVHKPDAAGWLTAQGVPE